jgi:hypothetical protein
VPHFCWMSTESSASATSRVLAIHSQVEKQVRAGAGGERSRRRIRGWFYSDLRLFSTFSDHRSGLQAEVVPDGNADKDGQIQPVSIEAIPRSTAPIPK